MNKVLNTIYEIAKGVNHAILTVASMFFLFLIWLGLVLLFTFLEYPSIAELTAWLGLIIFITYIIDLAFRLVDERINKNE